jgi:hypothetical protein
MTTELTNNDKIQYDTATGALIKKLGLTEEQLQEAAGIEKYGSGQWLSMNELTKYLMSKQ